VGTSNAGKGGKAALVVGVGGCAGGSAEMSALSNGKLSALAVGLGGCAGSRRGFRRSLPAALRRRLSQWADVRWAMWG